MPDEKTSDRQETKSSNERSGQSSRVSRRQVLSTSAGALAGLATMRLGSASETGEKIPVPTGEFVDPSHVHSVDRAGVGRIPDEVKSGRPDTSQASKSEDSPPAPEVQGWWAFCRDHYLNGTYSHMDADFNVPSEPNGYDAANDPVMFQFPALQNCDDLCNDPSYIIQPVLQWNWYNGNTGEGYVGDWAISSWYRGTDGDYYSSTPMKVSVGDTLWGYMKQKSDYSWYIQTYNYATGEYTDIYTDKYNSSLTFDRAFTTLEVANYVPGNCGRLPGDCTFDEIWLQDSNGSYQKPEWGTNVNNDAECNVNAKVIDQYTTKTVTP